MFNFLRILAIVTIIISLPQSSFADNHRTMEVKVYFSDFSKTADCNIVKEIVRRVPKTKSIATAALQELFKGPTETEKKEFEVGSEFSHLSKSILKSLKIENGIAYVNFNGLGAYTGLNFITTSCGGTAFLTQIEMTLKQFRTVKKVFYAINENPAKFYESMQFDCPQELENCSGENFLVN